MHAVEVDADAERFPAVDRERPGSSDHDRSTRRRSRPRRPASVTCTAGASRSNVTHLRRSTTSVDRDAADAAGPPGRAERLGPHPERDVAVRRAGARADGAGARTVVERHPVRADCTQRVSRPSSDSTTVARTTFIDGVPTNWATKRLRGWSYTSIGIPHCSIAPAAHHRQPIAHRHRLVVIVRDVQRRDPEAPLHAA